MKKLGGIFALLAVFCLMASFAYAQEEKPEAPKDTEKKADIYVGKVTATHLNVRSGPGEQFRILRVLDEKEEIIVIETSGSWCKILAPDNVFVFIAKKYVKDGVVDSDNVQLRPTADTKHPNCGILDKGAKVESVGEENFEWLKIKAPDETECWVSSKYVTQDKAYEGPRADELKKKKEAAVKQAAFRKQYDEALKIAGEEDIKATRDRDYTAAITYLDEVAAQSGDDKMKSTAAAKVKELKEKQQIVNEIKAILRDIPSVPMPDPFGANVKTLDLTNWNYTGFLEDVGLYLERTAQYKLTKGGTTMYFLKTNDPNIKLDSFLFKFVGINGEITFEKGSKIPTIIIKEIKALVKE